MAKSQKVCAEACQRRSAGCRPAVSSGIGDSLVGLRSAGCQPAVSSGMGDSLVGLRSAGCQPADATQSRPLLFGPLSFVLYLVFGLFGFGISPHASADSAPTIQISTTTAQPLRFGIDAERLWYWYPAIGPQLAEIGVKQLNAAYVRVAINCAYEREEGVKDPSAYDDILSMMADMKKASPGIKFFATPRPLAQAYTAAETEAIFGVGGSVPWTMYPGWISGIKQLGGTTFDVQKLIQYFADYLNFMHAHGFDIDYMDISNEKQDASPADMALIHNTLPGLLDPGVKMPLIIAPSTWSPEQGTAFLNSLSTAGGQDKAFEIASTHNTGADTFLEDFAAAARRLDKESWNTEMHNWTGTNQAEDITNSAIFWNHLAAGFTGIDTWLFYGSAQESSKTVLGRQVNTYRNTADGSFVVTAATQTGMLATIAIAGVDTFEMRVDNGDAGIQTAPSLPCGNTPENTPDTQPVSKQNLPPADQIHTSNVLIIYNEADETPERNPDSLTTRYVSQIEAANIVLLNSDIPLQWNLVGVEKIPAYTVNLLKNGNINWDDELNLIKPGEYNQSITTMDMWTRAQPKEQS